MSHDSGTRTVVAKAALTYPETPLGLDERFWSKVDIREPDECWEFMGARTSYGYGRFKLGQVTNANRLVLGLRVGDTGWALHHCDNPPCVNPAHLYIGTPSDNSADTFRRNRRKSTRGALSGRASDEELILKIRTLYALGHTPKAISDRLRRNPSWIIHVVKGRRWADGPWPTGDNLKCCDGWCIVRDGDCIKCGWPAE